MLPELEDSWLYVLSSSFSEMYIVRTGGCLILLLKCSIIDLYTRLCVSCSSVCHSVRGCSSVIPRACFASVMVVVGRYRDVISRVPLVPFFEKYFLGVGGDARAVAGGD